MLLVSLTFAALVAGRTTAAPPVETAPTVESAAPGESSSVAATSPRTAWQPTVAEKHWTTIVLHHSATEQGDVASIDAVHRGKRDPSGKAWLGIGYHFVVGNGRKMADGEVQPTFRWQQQLAGAHAGQRDYNENGIGICVIGNFDEAAPTARQMTAVRDLIKTLAARHAIPRERIVRHQDVTATACPGRLFPWDQAVSGVPGTTKGS